MEQLGRRVAERRVSLLGKGLTVNPGNSKVMVGSSGWKMIVNSVNWPVVSVGKECRQTMFKCIVCKKWIHKRCSGVRGDLSLVIDGFRCKPYYGTIHEANLAEDLV